MATTAVCPHPPSPEQISKENLHPLLTRRRKKIVVRGQYLTTSLLTHLYLHANRTYSAHTLTHSLSPTLSISDPLFLGRARAYTRTHNTFIVRFSVHGVVCISSSSWSIFNIIRVLRNICWLLSATALSFCFYWILLLLQTDKNLMCGVPNLICEHVWMGIRRYIIIISSNCLCLRFLFWRQILYETFFSRFAHFYQHILSRYCFTKLKNSQILSWEIFNNCFKSYNMYICIYIVI